MTASLESNDVRNNEWEEGDKHRKKFKDIYRLRREIMERQDKGRDRKQETWKQMSGTWIRLPIIIPIDSQAALFWHEFERSLKQDRQQEVENQGHEQDYYFYFLSL